MIGVAALTACSGSTHAGRTTTVTATATVTRTVKPAAPTPASPTTYRVGQTYTVPNDGTRATVLGHAREHSTEDSASGRTKDYYSINVKVCAAHKTTVGDGAWTLVGSDDSTNDTIVTGGGLQEPQYVNGNVLNAGECARGWITFDVPRVEKIAVAKYSPGDGKGATLGTARWRLV